MRNGLGAALYLLGFGVIKTLIGLSAVFVLSACASNRVVVPGPASVAERNLAVAAYMDCLRAEVARIDDGVSDPFTIGQIAAPACRPSLQFAVGVMARGANANVHRLLYDRRVSESASDAARAVLDHRRSLAAKP
jgi:hypothetical protein